MGIEPTTSGLDLPLLCRLSYEVGQRESGTIYTSELILCFTICVHSATRHNIHMFPYFLFAAIHHLNRGRWFSLWPFKRKLCKSTLTSWIITSINPRFLTIQTKTIKNTINFAYIFPKNSNHEGVNELKFWPVSCHGYWAWYAINEVSVLEVWVFGIWERSSSIEPDNFNC